MYYQSFDAAFLLLLLCSAVERLTSTVRDASGAPNLATGQEIVPPYEKAKEMSTGEPVLAQDAPIVSTRKVAEPKRSPVPSSEVFDEEINEIAQQAY